MLQALLPPNWQLVFIATGGLSGMKAPKAAPKKRVEATEMRLSFILDILCFDFLKWVVDEER